MSGAVREPKGLGEAGRELWRSVLADVAEGWRLDARDLALLEAACRAADRVQVLEDAVDADGLMVSGSTGQEVLHPAVSEARMQRQLMTALLAKVELAPPQQRTGHLSAKQRNQLADARRRRWPAEGGGRG